MMIDKFFHTLQRVSAVALFVVCSSAIASAQDKAQQRLDSLERAMESLDNQRTALELPLERAKLAVLRRDLHAFGLPALRPGDVVVDHPGHSLVFSAERLMPVWTAHIVTTDVIHGNLARIDTFMADPNITASKDLFNEYWFSGYDRGHMVPSADMRWSQEALQATYYYSNIGPQRAELNRETWAELEDWVRRAVRYGKEKLYVVTGPIFGDETEELTTPKAQEHVRVPQAYFKAVVDLDGDSQKGVAFIMKNGTNEYPPMSYAVPIDSVEKLTGLDLFAAVDDRIEAAIESSADTEAWFFEGGPFLGEVEPLKAPLAKGLYNTVQAKYHIGNEVTVCGTVVSTRRTSKANAIYLNMDRLHPHQDFYATIWDYNGPNFSYDPEVYLVGKCICVTGKVTMYQDIPRISVNNEKEIQFWDEIQR